MAQKSSGGMVVGVFVFVMVIVVGKYLLHKNPNLLIDLLPESIVSEEDKKVLRDPNPASRTWQDHSRRGSK